MWIISILTLCQKYPYTGSLFCIWMRRKVHIKIATKFAVHEMASLSNGILEVYKATDHLTVIHNIQSALKLCTFALQCYGLCFDPWNMVILSIPDKRQSKSLIEYFITNFHFHIFRFFAFWSLVIYFSILFLLPCPLQEALY